MTKLEFLKTLPKREKIYIIFSRLTHLPYVECNGETFDDEVFLFTEEADALERAKELSAEKGIDFCRRLRDAGVKTVIYTDISRDGAGVGTNLEVYEQLQEIKGLSITASGGVSSLEEIAKLEAMGVSAAILGKAIYSGRLELAEVIKNFPQQEG